LTSVPKIPAETGNTVTGGGTGIGLMCTKALAANGCKVYITGRRKDVLQKAAKDAATKELLGDRGGSIVPIEMDVTSKPSIQAAVEEVK
jgi:NAD(P)-dependent dehydrogenase (short-subunit alcohol dehydrogenase family)